MKKMSTEAMRKANGGAKAIAYCWTCKEAGIDGWRSSSDGTGTFGLTVNSAKKNALKKLVMHTDGDTQDHNVTYMIL